jgi:hypothetical protein
MRSSLLLCGAFLFGLGAVACGPQFDPGSELKTLRVLGVKKDKPYAQPGDQVNLRLLWHDAKGPRPVQSLFIGGCINPPGDLYYGCFSQYGEAAAGGGLPPIMAGDSFDVTLPDDIISGRGGLEPGQPRYGLEIVFFAVCAGTLSFDMEAASATNAGSAGLPLRCLDEDGEPLASDDFVVGYTSIYSFQGVSNQNPELAVNDAGEGEFEVAGKRLRADCVGVACQGAEPVEVDCDAEPDRCVEACEDDGDDSCPAIDVKPAIVQNVEVDQVSTDLFGSRTTEQMWVNYYVDRGAISDVRLLNDSTSGWNAKYRGELRAPKANGPLQVWSVVHDNRGGMEFSRVTLEVVAKK